MIDELKDYGANSYINEFASAGPKYYGYIVRSGNDGKDYFVVKVKGFTLNYVTASRLNFKTLRQMVKNFVNEESNDSVERQLYTFMF